MKILFFESFSYLLVGLLQYLVDVSLFTVLLSTTDYSPEWSNIISRFGAALMGFILNLKVTFRHQVCSDDKFSYFNRFVLLWLGLTLLSTLLILLASLISNTPFFLLISKIMIEFLLAIFAFISSKYWVYVDEK